LRKKILDRAARKKSPPLKVLESISEMEDGDLQCESSDGETDCEDRGASTTYSTAHSRPRGSIPRDVQGKSSLLCAVAFGVCMYGTEDRDFCRV
jgi:hypothetical protein